MLATMTRKNDAVVNDLAGTDLGAPLDVLVRLLRSIPSESIDSDHLGTAPDQPLMGEEGLMPRLNDAAATPIFPGSISGLLPEEVYVFARGTDPSQPIRMGQVGWGKKCHVITDRFKHLLEALPGRRSEFYPVSVVYRDPHETAELGGGEVVRDRHWLWFCYAIHDLVDVPASRAVFRSASGIRLDLPTCPRVDYQIVGNMSWDGPPSLVLRGVPYQQDAAFHVLGLSSSTPFVSPDLVRALQRERETYPADMPKIVPAVLDRLRASQADMAVDAGTLASKPPLRIVGTDWIIRDGYDPPFYPERPHYAGA